MKGWTTGAGRVVARTVTLALALAVAAVTAAAAEPRNPQLVARGYIGRQGDQPRAEALKISRLDISVALRGGVAVTTVSARFDNPTSLPLEGDFTLDLPPASVVTGYALDVDGRMLDGVLTPKRQATLAYRARVRGNIDPGLAEAAREGAFRTRVFPIPAGGGRTVRLSFATPLSRAAPYRLPLNVPDAVQVSLDVRAEDLAGRTAIAGPAGLPLRWAGGSGGLTARARADGRPLSGALVVGPVRPAGPVLLSSSPAGERFFDLNDAADAPAAAAPVRRLRVYWDRSRSRRDDDLAAEIALLQRYLEAERPGTLDILLFADDGPELRTLAAPDARAVGGLLRGLDYEGATSLERVLAAAPPPADACLIFSDGTVTLDPYRAGRVGCPLIAVSSAPDADRGFLGALARASGGEHLDLRAGGTPETALARLRRREPRVTGITDGSGGEVDYAPLPGSAGGFRAVGRAPASGALEVELSDGSRRRYGLSGAAAPAGGGASALWAAEAAARLGATDRPDLDALVALARRYSVATPSAVFLVLETAEDCAQSDVEPPATAGAELLRSWRELAAERRAEKAAARAERLTEVVEAWEEQRRWWRTRFDPRARPKRSRGRAGDSAVAAEAVPPPPASPAPAMELGGGDDEVQAVVVTGARRSSQAGSAIVVEVEPWNPNRPYLQVLRAAAPADFRRVYLEQERRHGDLPAFYFDVAEFLFRAGRAAEARRVASNALELPSADAGTRKILADRLLRYGDDRRAVWLYEQVLHSDADRPQPRRDLALALIARSERPGAAAEARRADQARAPDLLTEIAMTPWDGAYDGVELIALTEANRLIPGLRRVGVEPTLDRRLIALMDVDLRVVLEWSTDATDMDLWVAEPTGERAAYDNPRTAVGGRLSNDMTQGYGPEEYMVRRAPDGRYTVWVHAFAGDRLDPNGAVTVRAHLFRDWGRPTQAVEVAEIELQPDEDASGRLVGSLTVARSRR